MPIGSINNSLFTALSGIQTAQTLLNTTSRNIVNAQTPGYVVKNEQAVSNAATGGVQAGPIARFIDASLQQKARTNNADAAFAAVRSSALTQMDQLSGNPTDGTSINAVADVSQINLDLQSIANLNQQVVSASANGKDPTDLQDQRDTAVNSLSKLMGVNAFLDNQGVLQVLSADFKPLAGLYAEH